MREINKTIPDETPAGQGRTRSVTFRIDNAVIDEVQREADQTEIPLNVLVNPVLKRYTEWDRYENKVGMMPVPKAILPAIIDKSISLAKEEGIKDVSAYRDRIFKHAAKMAFQIMKDTVLFMKKNYNLWTVLSVLQEYMKVSDINSNHKIEPGGRHVFIVQHDLGDNWSIFTKELMSMMFEDLAKVRADINTTPNTVVAGVRL
jgi:hypothetical protein